MIGYKEKNPSSDGRAAEAHIPGMLGRQMAPWQSPPGENPSRPAEEKTKSEFRE